VLAGEFPNRHRRGLGRPPMLRKNHCARLPAIRCCQPSFAAWSSRHPAVSLPLTSVRTLSFFSLSFFRSPRPGIPV
jgi:hypothetical protein